MFQTPIFRMLRVTHLVSFLVLCTAQFPTRAIATESRESVHTQNIERRNFPFLYSQVEELNACNPEAIAPEPSLMAVMPRDQDQISTVKGLPAFFFYLPKTSAETAEFILSDESDRLIYRLRFTVTGNPGLIRLPLPLFINLQPLEIQKVYRWSLAVICNRVSPAQNLISTGTIQRLQPSAALARQLQTASFDDHPQIYAEAGLWMDALSSLADLKQQPNGDRTVNQKWEMLLESMELEALELGTFLRWETE